MSEIFRPEALAGARRGLDGEVILASPLSQHFLVAGVVIVAISTVAFLCVANYARQENAVGWVVPAGGIVRVSAPQGGVVVKLFAAEHDQVTEGQPLALLRQVRVSEAGDLDVSLRAGQRDEVAALDAKSRAASARRLAQGEVLNASIAAIRAQIAAGVRREGLMRERLRISHEQVERGEEIAQKGFMSPKDLGARRAAALEVEESLNLLITDNIGLRRQLAEAEGQKAMLRADEVTSQAELSSASAELRQVQAKTEAEASFLAKAPVAGELSALSVGVGQTVPANGPVALVTPAQSPLEAELFVPSKAAGFIRSGQVVRLMYDAYPFTKFGLGTGTVMSVSSSALAPDQIAIPGLSIREPMFRVRVRLSDAKIRAYGTSYALRAGMTLNARVELDRRSLAEWLLDPLYAAGRRG